MNSVSTCDSKCIVVNHVEAWPQLSNLFPVHETGLWFHFHYVRNPIFASLRLIRTCLIQTICREEQDLEGPRKRTALNRYLDWSHVTLCTDHWNRSARRSALIDENRKQVDPGSWVAQLNCLYYHQYSCRENAMPLSWLASSLQHQTNCQSPQDDCKLPWRHAVYLINIGPFQNLWLWLSSYVYAKMKSFTSCCKSQFLTWARWWKSLQLSPQQWSRLANMKDFHLLKRKQQEKENNWKQLIATGV